MGTQREPELPLQDDIRRYSSWYVPGREGSPDAQQLRAHWKTLATSSTKATWQRGVFSRRTKFGKAG